MRYVIFLISCFILCACTDGGTQISSEFHPGVLVSSSGSSVSVAQPQVASGQKVLVTLALKDSDGKPYVSTTPIVQFMNQGGTSTGSFDSVVNNGDGTYQSFFTGLAVGTATNIIAIVDGFPVTGTSPTMTVIAGNISIAYSSLNISPASLKQVEVATLTVTLKDTNNNSLTSGGASVSFARTTGVGESNGTISASVDHGDGTYTATYTASAKGAANTLSAFVLGAGTLTATVTETVTNSTPTLTSISTLTSASENTAYTISYASLLAASNASDADSSDTISFLIQVVSSGTLTKNAVAVVAGTTLLSSGESLVWTPASNAYGANVNAFTVKAYDGTANSASAVQVKVAVNSPPTISSISDQFFLANTQTANINLAFTIADNESTLSCSTTSLSVTSSSLAFIPLANLSFSGTAPNCNLVVHLLGSTSGSSNLAITVTDGSLTASTSFQFQLASAPAAAFSLRKIVATYAGKAIQVRRSSDNTTQDIGFDSSLNLDQSALTTFVGSGSGYVTTWYDQSNSGRDATSAVSSAQPRIVAGGIIDTALSQPSLHFFGSTGGSFNVLYPAGGFASTDSIWAVMNFTAGGDGFFVSDDNSYQFHSAQPTNLFTAQYAAGNVQNGTVWLNNTSYSPTTNCPLPNSLSTVQLQTAGAAGTNWNNIGKDRVYHQLTGFYSELIVYTSAPGASDRAAMQANQKAYYGTP